MKKYNDFIKEDVTTEPEVTTETTTETPTPTPIPPETPTETPTETKAELTTQFVPPSDKKLEEIIKKEAPILKNE